jgi:ribosome maturation factor RimP
MDVEATIKPVVEHDGLELVEVSFAGTSERISRRLDLEGFEPGPYTLEVSSPGLERPLRSPRDFARRVGQRVRVRVARPDASPETIDGTIVGATDENVTIGTDAGERTVAHASIVGARTVFEWGDERQAPRRREKV